MTDLTLPLEGLSSVNGKSVIARFDGGTLSSDSGVIALGEVEKRLGVLPSKLSVGTAAACMRRRLVKAHRRPNRSPIGFI